MAGISMVDVPDSETQLRVMARAKVGIQQVKTRTLAAHGRATTLEHIK
jgi:hypothetical protein